MKKSTEIHPEQLVLNEAQTARVLGVSVSQLKRMRKAGGAPKPIQLSAHRIGWRRRDIEAWLDAREPAS